ncbi:hypothetical protein [Streptomyces sp. CBMA152]|uniref:hypothetical protein n=1 Tax=Streptomyces sp. CBMA152 TaxID=1896312 RepID=UPI0016605943|nr:hypothetical protein [Streptomyces sp. CBMA152]MBD0743023.1 hypothetical protein [Streptomyces sp. CBMA152]
MHVSELQRRAGQPSFELSAQDLGLDGAERYFSEYVGARLVVENPEFDSQDLVLRGRVTLPAVDDAPVPVALQFSADRESATVTGMVLTVDLRDGRSALRS